VTTRKRGQVVRIDRLERAAKKKPKAAPAKEEVDDDPTLPMHVCTKGCVHPRLEAIADQLLGSARYVELMEEKGEE
jgi:hypothetical protein